MSDLPNGWSKPQLSDVCHIIMGQAPPGAASNFAGIGTPFVKAGEFGDERPVVREWTTKPLKYAKAGDVLICVVGATSGKINLGIDCAIGRSVAALRPLEGCEQSYLYAFMKTQVTSLRGAATGTAQGVISSAMLGAVELPMAPVPEQIRIASKVEAFTARTRQAREELANIPTLVARYRSAIVELGLSGKMTGEFRPKKNSGIDASGLPTGWVTRPLEDISEIQGGIQVGKKRSSNEKLVVVPYLRVANVQRGWLNLQDIKEIAVTQKEKDRLLLRKGDILMNEGGDRDKLGRGWIWNDQIRACIHQNHVFRIRLKNNILPPEFVSHFANERGQKYFFDQGTQTTNLASVSKRRVAALPVPIPPYDEALEIVRRIDTAFNWLERVSADCDRAFSLLSKLDSAILARAFRGELTPQNSNEEAAEQVLERMRSERKSAPRVKKELAQEAVAMPVEKSLEDVLRAAKGWISAQDAFEKCEIGDGLSTEDVERFYAQLRALDASEKVEVEAVPDKQGRKIFDRLRWKGR